MRSVSYLVLLLPLFLLSACATAPSRINDVCAVFDQNDGFLNDWHRDAKRAEAKHGVPVHILMATIRKESGFKGNARPPRKYILGFIPWGRVSSAHGYSQALDGTWAQYQRETGRFMARRTKFADAVDFVGWYHEKSADALGIARNDAYNLYLAYYFGWKGYANGEWKRNAGIQRYARDTAKMAANYQAQMQRCGRR
jgi:hypothetical protein